MKKVIMDHVMDIRFELQYKAIAEVLNEALFSCLRQLSTESIV